MPILFFSTSWIYAQHNTLSGIVTDSATGNTVPFANIVFEDGIRGTVSGLDGKFSVERNSAELTFTVSCLGYETANITVPLSEKFVTVKLVPKQYELSGVNIFPGENPALTLMEKVYALREKNNHDLASNYKCLIYHKTIFTPDTAALRSDTSVFANSHVMLIESVSEKKHIAPDKDSERIISTRTSGFQNTMFAVLPVITQSFTVYNDNINLFGYFYTNPVSRVGLQKYFFILEDTLLDAQGDTLFYVSFRPHKNANIVGVEGAMHVHAPTFGVKSVSAKTRTSTGSNSNNYSIRETYRYIDGKQWFPEQFEGKLEMIMNGRLSPISVQSTSFVASVELNPELKRRDFTAITLTDETGTENLPVENFRYMPLTAKDSATYHLLDSLGRVHNFDRFMNSMSNIINVLIDGFIPVGPVKLELNKTLDYNLYEGLKLGAGLWTSNKLMKHLSVGGFYYRSFKSKNNNYGAGLKLTVSKRAEADVHLQWEKRNFSFGKINYLQERTSFTSLDLSNYLTNSMETVNLLKGSFTTRFLNYFRANLYYEYSDVTPVTAVSFMKNDSSLPPAFLLHEYGVKLKWANKETFAYVPQLGGLLSNGTNWPVIWTNLSFANGVEPRRFKYTKLETQIAKRFITREAFKNNLRITAGNIWGNAPPSKLYSLFGLYMDNLNYDMENYFAVMRPNEFAASRFVNAFWRSTFYTRLNRPGSFKPEITLSTSVGWGDVDGDFRQSFKTYRKGYYESGILFGNLMKSLFTKLGIGVHYRYGAYHLPREFDNWAVTLMLQYGL
ncbi:MAG: DUF5686 and carboxypeptidase regulatory-like domain-containing protein [Cytophagaceae bacterium]|nr:DUF5686 and carboxypeptidase regulatory-like domain-containing protein [Cytophagaceae bacterium]